MVRITAFLALLAAAATLSAPSARAQALDAPPATDARVAPPAAATTAAPSDPRAGAASLAFPPSSLRIPTGSAPERGIEDATTGVWVGGAVGAITGALVASWAYCGLGEGDCEFSITAAGPGMLIGAILGASIGGMLDQDDDEREAAGP